jgi:hypothetical protein
MTHLFDGGTAFLDLLDPVFSTPLFFQNNWPFLTSDTILYSIVLYSILLHSIVLYCGPNSPTGALLDYQSACIAFMELRDFM